MSRRDEILVHLIGVKRCVPADPAEVYVALPVEKADKVTCPRCREKVPRGTIIRFPGPKPRSPQRRA